MQIVMKKTRELIPYARNNKVHNERQVKLVAASIQEFGFKNPVIVDKDNSIIAGHGRVKAAELLKLDEVPCIVANDLTKAQVKAYRIADNKLADLAEYDIEMLQLEVQELQGMEFDVDLLGVDLDEFEEEKEIENITEKKYSLSELFLFNPFSVLDGRTGAWLNRKKEWISMGIKSEEGRIENLMHSPESSEYVNGTCSHFAPSTSIFDPVICELMYKWFCVSEGVILDPFAGGSVRGIVASKLGYKYHGNDLREEQILQNIKNAKEVECTNELFPVWTVGDSLDINVITENIKADMVFSCPPYADLEVYSDNEKDISNMKYPDFLNVYRQIIKNTCSQLKDNRFAVFVVGDVRDKNGFYYDFISDTKKAFIDCGLKLYNEIIKIDPNGTAGLRAKNAFSNRKCVKVHQNIVVFYKGDIRKIKDNYKEIEWADIQNDFND